MLWCRYFARRYVRRVSLIIVFLRRCWGQKLGAEQCCLPEQPLDNRGDEDTLDDGANYRLGGGEPGLQDVEAEQHEGDGPVESVEADLQCVGALPDGRDGAVWATWAEGRVPHCSPGVRLLRYA
jgi:hypothetical protein